MKEEDKELLLKDLCARLPYGVHIWTNDKKHLKLRSIDQDGINGYWANDVYEIDEVKPYLRPMSPMTEEEKEQIRNLWIDADTRTHAIRLIDFYNKHNLDFRGLIDKGLAIEVTEENNPYKD